MARVAVAAAVAAALALGAGAVYQGTSGDRRLADSYRAVLAQGHGSFFAAAPLKSPAGTLASVFRIPGPALLAVCHPEPAHGTARTLRNPADHPRRQAPVPRRNGPRRHPPHRGAQIPVNLTQVSQLRFEAASGQFTMTAYLNPRNPWSPG